MVLASLPESTTPEEREVALSEFYTRWVLQERTRLDKYNEDYLITFPQLHLEGFIPPPPYPEFDAEPVYIQSSSGFTGKITFSGKGWLRGKRNSFFATLYPEGKESFL